MRKSNFFLTVATAALLLSNGASLSAQVTVGSDKTPEKFSLLELVSGNNKGLRLPQMTTEQRMAMENSVGFKDNPNAWGLQIFNTTTLCVETWNGSAWIATCGEMPKIVPSVLSDELSNNRVTTFTNVMYDFQHQTLTAYLDPTGTATAWQWEMSTDGGSTWFNIVGATSANYIVPADFMYDYANMNKNDKTRSESNSSIEVFFRCLMTNSSNVTGHTPGANLLKMLFIRTNTDGYGQDPIGSDTIRYLTIQTKNTNFLPSLTMKIALLNLGQSGTGAWIRDPNNANIVTHKPDDGTRNDAGDLGDFYQWGRVADGHEHIVWSKDPSTRDNVFGNGSSDYISGLAPAANLNGNGQIKDDGNDFYGKFITASSGYWENGNPNKLWGNGGANSRTGSDIPLSSPPPTTPPTSFWTYQSNNPCPDNWSVPSSWNFFDICNGGGSTPSTLPTNTSIDWSSWVIKGVNTWQLRETANYAIGGAIITNANSEKVFLPAAGYRYYLDASLGYVGTVGSYCSSSVISTSAYLLNFNTGNVYVLYPGNYSNYRAYGFGVRCVSK